MSFLRGIFAGRGTAPNAPPPQGAIPYDDIVRAVYTSIHLRPPTEREVEEGNILLQQGGVSWFMTVVVQNFAFRERVSDVRKKFDLSEDRLINCVSQNGEIESLLKLIANEACPTRTVVDAGAHGRHGSNSYDLLRYLGWRGLLIEANPKLVEKIRVDFGDFNCHVESCAVSDYDGEATFTIGINDEVSALDADKAERWGGSFGKVKVSVRRLGSILDQHAIPHEFDLLSLDLEGQDITVLDDLIGNTRYRPKWIIVEGPQGGAAQDLAEVGFSSAVAANYRIVGNSLANIFLRRV